MMKNPINRIKESFSKIREWLNLWKRVKELEKEMGKVLDELKSMNKKLDKLDNLDNLDSIKQLLEKFMKLSVSMYDAVKGTPKETVELKELIKQLQELMNKD